MDIGINSKWYYYQSGYEYRDGHWLNYSMLDNIDVRQWKVKNNIKRKS